MSWLVFGFFFVYVLLCFVSGLVLAVISWYQLNRDDVMIVSSEIDRQGIVRYLGLKDKDKNEVDKEIEVRLRDD